MKNFIKNIFFIVILLIVVIAISKLYVPYYWLNSHFGTKVAYLNKTTVKYNTYFFGSSVVYHQINPGVFDSIVNKKTDLNIRSYNLGSPATFPPQSYYLYENFLKNDVNSIVKYVFIELKRLSFPSLPIRDEYWQNLSDVAFLFKAVSEDKNLSLRQKIDYYRYTTYRYLKNLFADNQLGTFLFTKDFYDSMYLGENKDGFLSLDSEYEHTTHLKNKEGLRQRREQLLDKNFTRRKISSQEVSTMFKNKGKKVSETHLKRINYLIEISKRRDIQLIFFISPKSTNQALIDMFKKISKKNRLEFSQSPHFMEIFQKENLYDAAHANEQGAKLYSKIFAKEFIKTIKE